jgi:hypothetical protein
MNDYHWRQRPSRGVTGLRKRTGERVILHAYGASRGGFRRFYRGCRRMGPTKETRQLDEVRVWDLFSGWASEKLRELVDILQRILDERA